MSEVASPPPPTTINLEGVMRTGLVRFFFFFFQLGKVGDKVQLPID